MSKKKKFSARTRSIPPAPAQAAEEKNVVTPYSRAMGIKSEIWLQHAQENRQRHESLRQQREKPKAEDEGQRLKNRPNPEKKLTPQIRSKN
jgi:hypothetical protein